jgi:hypothetical protein
VYAVLDDQCLFEASLASIYDHVDRITVITTHDRDWRHVPRSPGSLVERLLERACDPARKIDVLVTTETSEARARNRAMDYAAPRRRSLAVTKEHDDDQRLEPPDYFLIVDADEIYEADALPRIYEFVARERRQLYRVACVRYFKEWNYRVDGYEWAVSLVRADQRLPYLRMRKPALPRRAVARVPALPDWARSRLLGFLDIPPEVGVFHHGSYVGPRERIAAKLGSFGHAADVRPGWLEETWDTFSADVVDFHPVKPWVFPSATHVANEDLPAEIHGAAWPPGYLQ